MASRQPATLSAHHALTVLPSHDERHALVTGKQLAALRALVGLTLARGGPMTTAGGAQPLDLTAAFIKRFANGESETGAI